MRITDVTIDGAKFNGTPCDWRILVEACLQPDADLHLPYRDIAAQAVPLVAERTRAAYDRYAKLGVKTPSRDDGHGSTSIAPALDRQSEWDRWDHLLTRLKGAAEGKGSPVLTERLHRVAPGAEQGLW